MYDSVVYEMLLGNKNRDKVFYNILKKYMGFKILLISNKSKKKIKRV